MGIWLINDKKKLSIFLLTIILLFVIPFSSAVVLNPEISYEELATLPEHTVSQTPFEYCNNALWIVGGVMGNTVTSNKTYKYDISTNSWSRLSDLPIASQSPTLKCYNNKLYYFGGLYYEAVPDLVYNKTYEYNIASDTWTEKSNMLHPVEDMGSGLIDDTVYIFGGLYPDVFNQTYIVQAYNISSDTWSYKKNLTNYQWAGDFGTTANNGIYLAGGNSLFKETPPIYPYIYPINTTLFYNPTLDDYTTLSPMPLAVAYREIQELDNKIYSFGGAIQGGASGGYRPITRRIQIYDIPSNTWTLTNLEIPDHQNVSSPNLAKVNNQLYLNLGNRTYSLTINYPSNRIDSETIIQSLGLNTTLNFTSTFYADIIQTKSSFIYFESFRLSDAGTEYITMNITNRNMTGFNAPYISASSSTSKTITSQLSQGINATVVVDVDYCPIDGTYDGSPVSSNSCNGNQATFLLTIPSGASTLIFGDAPPLNCSSNTGASIAIILIFSALAIVAITFIIVMKFKEGELDVKILIIVFIALIVGLVLFTQIAQLTGSVCN